MPYLRISVRVYGNYRAAVHIILPVASIARLEPVSEPHSVIDDGRAIDVVMSRYNIVRAAYSLNRVEKAVVLQRRTALLVIEAEAQLGITAVLLPLAPSVFILYGRDMQYYGGQRHDAAVILLKPIETLAIPLDLRILEMVVAAALALSVGILDRILALAARVHKK